MNKFRFAMMALAIMAFTLIVSSGAQAQATRTWVSGVGDDVNPCSRTAPCKTYAGAISKTAKDGEISTLDPGGFGTVTITKSLTINGTHGQGYGSILAALTTGVIINITDAADVRKTVRLISLNINGASTGIDGVRINAATRVHIEDTQIDGFTNRGINDIRAANGNLFVSGCVVRNTVQSGIVIIPGAAATVNALIENTQVQASTGNTGIALDARAIATVRNCNVSGSTTGVFANGATTQLNIENCSISHNGIGMNISGGAIARLINSVITNNTTSSMTAGSQAAVSSNGNNIISGNGANNLPTGPGLSPS
ncbi:MAG: right-handed parallel beta-helix repeat-containing protein [Pyrinomonadaceae bacterium]